jgi:tetratricopeptide (TPR) repeat protein
VRLLICSAALLAALYAAPADAAQIGDYTGSAESVTITGPVEVPLYLTPTQGLRPCVKVTIQGEDYLFALAPGLGIYAGPRVSAALELEPKKKTFRHFDGGEPLHYAQIGRISIGSLELREVRVLTDPPPPDDDLPDFYNTSLQDGRTIDGVLGLQSLPQLSWAVLPSKGTVLFAPAAQGRDLVASLQSDIVRYRYTPENVEVFGKNRSGNTVRMRMPPSDMIVPLTIGGQQSDVLLSFSRWTAALRADRELPPSATEQRGDRTYSWQPVQAGSQPAVFIWVYQSGSYQQLHDRAFRNSYADGIVGYRSLSQLDMAVDPADRSITFRYAPEQQRNDPISFLLDDAEAATTAEGDEPVATAAWQRLGDLYLGRGRLEEALDAYSEIVADDKGARSCESWMQLGKVQVDANHVEAALESFAKAAARYHSWWDQPLEDRETILEELKDLDEEALASETRMAQPGSCYRADGLLAAAHLSSGAPEKALALYRERLDLDEDLALIGGTAALMLGRLDEAQAAYRRSIQLQKSESSFARLGLALAYEAAGDWDSAHPLYQAAVEQNDGNVMGLQLWLDAVSRETSPEAALRKALAFRKANPDAGGAYVAIARTAKRAGDAAELVRVTEGGDRFFARNAKLYPYSTNLQATRALFLMETGRLDAARTLAEETLLSDPANVGAWLALGNIYVLQGDPDRGERLLHRAGRLAPMHPGYALLIDATVPRPTAAVIKPRGR